MYKTYAERLRGWTDRELTEEWEWVSAGLPLSDHDVAVRQWTLDHLYREMVARPGVKLPIRAS